MTWIFLGIPASISCRTNLVEVISFARGKQLHPIYLNQAAALGGVDNQMKPLSLAKEVSASILKRTRLYVLFQEEGIATKMLLRLQWRDPLGHVELGSDTVWCVSLDNGDTAQNPEASSPFYEGFLEPSLTEEYSRHTHD